MVKEFSNEVFRLESSKFLSLNAQVLYNERYSIALLARKYDQISVSKFFSTLGHYLCKFFNVVRITTERATI